MSLDAHGHPLPAPQAGDPLDVECIDCGAPAGVECRHSAASDLDGPHASRQVIADGRAQQTGTCTLCGRPLRYGLPPSGGAVTAWHDEADAACPRIPDPTVDPEGWKRAHLAGQAYGEPGPRYFDPDPVDK